jgi:hypothetical protein
MPDPVPLALWLSTQAQTECEIALGVATASQPNARAGEVSGPSRDQQWTMVLQDAEGAAGKKRPIGGRCGRPSLATAMYKYSGRPTIRWARNRDCQVASDA